MTTLSRRKFLTGAMTALSLAAVKPSHLVEAGLLDNLFGREGRETAPITPNDEFYITSYDITPPVEAEHWSLRIGGLVNNPLTFTYDDLLKRKHRSMIATLECIGNPVGGDSIGTATWEGIQLNTLLDEAGVESSAVDLVLRAADGYSDSFPVSRAMRDEVMLVTKMNGVPLPPDHGYPARIIVPGMYGMKNVKWLTELELVNWDYKGYWQQQSWPDDAFVKVQSRIDLPGDRETIRHSTYMVKGMAFGGLHGIRKVDVSTNAGATWHEATIEPRLSPYAWVRWHDRWEIPTDGEYTLVVRATDGSGKAQAAQLGGPALPGTIGLHAITVLVRNM